jgi:hypothetical protein
MARLGGELAVDSKPFPQETLLDYNVYSDLS